MKSLEAIEGILIGLIGRPILTIIKWLKWYILIFGISLNTITVFYKGDIIGQDFTILPSIFGFILFCVGLAVKRYDEIYKFYIEILKENKMF